MTRKSDCLRDCVGDVCEGCRKYITLETLAEKSFKQWQEETDYVYEGDYSGQPETIKNAHRENALKHIGFDGVKRV
jgi:hypothetical protein